MWLLVDDTRDMPVDVIARTIEAAKKCLVALTLDGVALDHDLGEKETGYDLIMWAIGCGVLPSKVQFITSNPVGRKRMEQALSEAGYSQIQGMGNLWVKREI